MKIGLLLLHSWEEIHHIHCMARSFYTGCDLKVGALGITPRIAIQNPAVWRAF